MDKNLTWFAGMGESAMIYLTGVNRRDFFLDKETCRLVYDQGRKAIIEIFGDRIRLRPPSCAHISYGHMASLGAKVNFPDNSEPNVEPMFSSLEEGIRWLKKDFDFSDAPLFKRYYNTYLYMKDAFPDETVIFSGYGYQGPITTAVLLRGQDFYMDIYDEPELACEYLEALMDNTIRFAHFLKKINNLPAINTEQGYITDDLSSLVSPAQWPQFVVPYIETYFRGVTTGKRGAHIENLSPGHLKYLAQLRLDSYDPSVSPQLSPSIIRKEIDTHFTWRLLGIRISTMTVSDVGDWVVDAVKQGAPALHTYISYEFCVPENRAKGMAFMDACERIEKEGI